MGYFGIWLVALACALSSYACAQLRPEQIFRNYERELQRWNNPAALSHPPTAPHASQSGQVIAQPYLAGPPQSQRPQAQQQLPFDEKLADLIAVSVLDFAQNIGQQLSQNLSAYAGKNEIFSPVSIMSALALLMLGAKGKSYQELRQVFGPASVELLQNPSKFHQEFAAMLGDLQRHDGAPTRMRQNANWRNTQANNIRTDSAKQETPEELIVRIANGLFVQTGYSVNPSYSMVLATVYRSELTDLDFAKKPAESRDHINSWVKRNTYGKISKILNDDIPSGTNIIIGSALYFKGFWVNSFFESATILDNFYPDGVSQPPVRVKMMATGGVFPYYETPECRIIGLPYKGNSTTMYVIQPHESTRATLRDLQQRLNAYKIDDMISKMTQKSAVVAFPKMKFMRNLNMKAILGRLGVNEIFSGSLSDLSLISGTQPTPTQLQNAPAPMKFHSSFVPLEGRYRDQALIFSRSDVPQSKSLASSNPPLFNRRARALDSLDQLNNQRLAPSYSRGDLFVEDILHKVDFEVNEQGTEAAAATLTYLRRSGTDVLFRAETPFLILIRDDLTKLPLFYGIINEPES